MSLKADISLSLPRCGAASCVTARHERRAEKIAMETGGFLQRNPLERLL